MVGIHWITKKKIYKKQGEAKIIMLLPDKYDDLVPYSETSEPVGIFIVIILQSL